MLAQQPPPAPTADYSGLKASIAVVEKGANLSEVLTHLVSEVNKHVERAAMFIVKNNAAVGWYARGFAHNDAVKALTVPLTADTVFRLVHGSRHATRGHVSHSPATAQALSRLGGDPQGVLAVPLILRDKVAAVLYCDTSQEEMPAATADLVEILVAFAGKVVDVLSAAPRPAVPGPAAGGTSPGLRPPAPAGVARRTEPAPADLARHRDDAAAGRAVHDLQAPDDTAGPHAGSLADAPARPGPDSAARSSSAAFRRRRLARSPPRSRRPTTTRSASRGWW